MVFRLAISFLLLLPASSRAASSVDCVTHFSKLAKSKVKGNRLLRPDIVNKLSDLTCPGGDVARRLKKGKISKAEELFEAKVKIKKFGPSAKLCLSASISISKGDRAAVQNTISDLLSQNPNARFTWAGTVHHFVRYWGERSADNKREARPLLLLGSGENKKPRKKMSRGFASYLLKHDETNELGRRRLARAFRELSAWYAVTTPEAGVLEAIADLSWALGQNKEASTIYLIAELTTDSLWAKKEYRRLAQAAKKHSKAQFKRLRKKTSRQFKP